MPIFKHIETEETYEVETCKYCDHQPALIYPWDQLAERQKDESVKCGNCVNKEFLPESESVTTKKIGGLEDNKKTVQKTN